MPASNPPRTGPHLATPGPVNRSFLADGSDRHQEVTATPAPPSTIATTSATSTRDACSRLRSSLLSDASIPSYGPLAALSNLIDTLSSPWPILELQRTHADLWRRLPEDARAGRAPPPVQQLLARTLQQCKSTYSSLIDLYHSHSSEPAIIDPVSGRAAAHHHVAETVRNFRLPIRSFSTNAKPVVAISLPNGPLLALAVLATTTYYTAAPVAHGSGVGKDQFRSDVLQSRSNLVLAAAADVDRLALRDPWLAEAGIDVLLVELSETMALIIRSLDGRIVDVSRDAITTTPNTPDDMALLLFTSGTSGTKKLVPLSVHAMVCGVAMVEESWGLSSTSRCLNQMPLHHVGGLIRNLFTPVFSGGSVICCSAFDANLFWDCVEDFAPTWYYASPSMHQVILDAGAARPESVARSRIQLVCNAAGGLLPSLAVRLREVFSNQDRKCIVLPSYGMTECMPISTPRLDYRLEKVGTSGVSVGPDISILDGRDQPLTASGGIGRIAVRGSPVFEGYLRDDHSIDTSCFTADGWFDTGDVGYLDADGYLYITGRSKEVINRGGELISPFEVEEAIVAAASNRDSPIYGRVSKALAFSLSHNVLQEVVGLAVVTPEGAHRTCLRGIQESVKSVLSQAKVPVLLVYMEGGLPTNNNKILRIRLAERLGMPEIADNTATGERYFEAVCPPLNTLLSTPIPCHKLSMSHDALHSACLRSIPPTLDYHIRTTDFYPELIIAPKDAHTAIDLSPDELLDVLCFNLDGYNVPAKILKVDRPFPRDSHGMFDTVALEKALCAYADTPFSGNMSTTELTVCKAFAQVLSIPAGDISPNSDFFELGGDSMGAGRLLSALRKEYPLRLPINVLFTNPRVSLLAQLIDQRLHHDQPSRETDFAAQQSAPLPGCDETRSSTNPLVMLLQLLPMCLLYPMKRAFMWTAFMYMLMETQSWPVAHGIPGRLLSLVISLAVGMICTAIVAPCFAIAFKWLVIGRCREGLYPMWASYHLRWWLVQKTVALCEIGAFGLTNSTRILYFRLLGMKVGRNVSIDPEAIIGEWDLITVDDNAVLEQCTVRPFAVERNTSMYLGRIRIGKNVSVGLASIIAAGTNIPDNACLGPNSSSWEVKDAADESNRDLAASKIPKAHWTLTFFLGIPATILVKFAELVPWLACLVGLVINSPVHNPDRLLQTIDWFASPNRVAWHYVALGANVSLGPLFLYLAVLGVKKSMDALCGKISPSQANQRSQFTRFRMAWLRSVMHARQFHKITRLFGTHYEATSVLARGLGSKIGKRVYWPGAGPSVQDWDLLDIGDDVVFGSRSHLVTSDGIGSDYVHVGSNAMVADRVVLLPGVELGEKTVMGSGALTRRNKAYAADTTWVGSKAGDALCLSADVPFDITTDSVNSGAGRVSREYRATRAKLGKMEDCISTVLDLDPSGSESTTLYNTRANTTVNSERSSFDVEQGRPGKTELSSSVDVSENEKNKSKAEVTTVQVTSQISVASNFDPEQSSSASPFGRAFYQGKAPYRVWGQFTVFCYSAFLTVFASVWWNVPSVSAVQIISALFRNDGAFTADYLGRYWYRPLALYAIFAAIIAAIMAVQIVAVLALTIAAKWIVIGRRSPGNYDWDKSSYCQRWQLFLHLESLRKHCFYGLGILNLLTGSNWLVLYFRALGAKIGNDCALFAGGHPSLLITEPDLLVLGDRVALDDASIVAHINSRGTFDLRPLRVGDRAVLRSGARLLAGAAMLDDTCLLEHSLVMAGDVVEPGVTMQGWPAEEFSSAAAARTPTLEAGLRWRVKETTDRRKD